MPAPSITAFAPGRVNLIGEHTDYHGGLCLPFAIDRGVTVRARPRTDGRLHARALDLGEEDWFAVDAVPPARGWRAFVRGIVAELAAAGHAVPGANVTITGDVPRGSGLSSSAALEIALALAMLEAAGSADTIDRLALARLCSQVENVWVGARTGLLDQIASLFAQPGCAIRLDLRTLSITPVPLELAGWRLAVLASHAAHDNAASGYNERRAECARAAELLAVPVLSDATLEAAARLPEPLDRRARHVLEENARVEGTIAALAAGDLEAVARLLDASHASLRDLLEVSVDAVEETVRRAHAAGARGARLVGGGFGGSVLALFPPGVTPPSEVLEVRAAGAARLLAA